MLDRDAAPASDDSPTGSGDSPPYNYSIDVPTVVEIEAVFCGLSNGKTTADEDYMPPELFKSSLEMTCL